MGRVFLSGDKLVRIQVNTLPHERHATPGKLLNLECCWYLSHGPFGKIKRVRTHLAGGSVRGTSSVLLRMVVITGWVSKSHRLNFRPKCFGDSWLQTLQTVLPRLWNQMVAGMCKLRITCVLLSPWRHQGSTARLVLEVGVHTKVFNRIRNSRNHYYGFMSESSHKVIWVLKVRQIGLNWANKQCFLHLWEVS